MSVVSCQLSGVSCQCVRCQVSGVRCQVSGVRCQVSGVRCQVSGVRCQVSGVRCQVSGVRCQVSGVRCQVSGVRCQVSGVRCQVSGVRCQVSGVRCAHPVAKGCDKGGASQNFEWARSFPKARAARPVGRRLGRPLTVISDSNRCGWNERPSAPGAKEDSPPFQRWVTCEKEPESPGDGTAVRDAHSFENRRMSGAPGNCWRGSGISCQWSVVSGQWSVVSGQWSVVSGQWSVVSGQWSVVSGQWSVVSCQLSVVSCDHPVAKDATGVGHPKFLNGPAHFRRPGQPAQLVEGLGVH